MENIENISFHLRTFDISPLIDSPLSTTTEIVDNNYGRVLCNGGLITWKNVNIKSVLGELYNKYDKFGIKLINFQVKQPDSDNNIVTGSAVWDSTLYMSGLPYYNSNSYNTLYNNNNEVVIGQVSTFYTFANNNFIPANLIHSNENIFYKPKQEFYDLTIEFKTAFNSTINGKTEKRVTLLSHSTFLFNIYGIE